MSRKIVVVGVTTSRMPMLKMILMEAIPFPLK